MRSVVRSVLAVVVIAMAAVAWPTGLRLTAANVSQGSFEIASVLPRQGAKVGVAHPVVVTFSRPVAERHAVEQALDVKSAPAMNGKFQWLENNVVQWVPNRYWPAHSTIALSVGSLRTDFETGPLVLGIADIEDHTFTVSVDGV